MEKGLIFSETQHHLISQVQDGLNGGMRLQLTVKILAILRLTVKVIAQKKRNRTFF